MKTVTAKEKIWTPINIRWPAIHIEIRIRPLVWLKPLAFVFAILAKPNLVRHQGPGLPPLEEHHWRRITNRKH